MKFHAMLWTLAFVALCPMVNCQPVPPMDHIIINDPRIFDLSDAGMGYTLADGPTASAELSLIQGIKGSIVGTAMITDDHLNTWGPIPLTGKVKVSGTNPLTIKLKGKGNGLPKITISGNYDAPLKLMKVAVRVKTPEKLSFQWNDSFVPDNADATGIFLNRLSTDSNLKGVIRGTYNINIPGSPSMPLAMRDIERRNSDYMLKGKGVNLLGNYNSALDIFSISQSKVSVGYGTIFTPGSLVTISSDNGFLRVF